MRTGIRTTEFWLSFVSVLVGSLLASGLFADGSTALRILGVAQTVLGALGYTVARTIAKGKG